MNFADFNWLVTLLASVPLAIAANMLTPVVKNWWASRSLRRAKRRIEALRAELADTAVLIASPRRLVCHGLIGFAKVAVLFTFATATAVAAQAIGSTSTARWAAALSTLIYVFAAVLGQRVLIGLNRVYRYGEHRSRTTRAISALASAYPALANETAPDVSGLTILLFPYVTNQGGYDTGIALVNTSLDNATGSSGNPKNQPFSTTPRHGTCNVYYFGAMASGGQLPAPQTTADISAGQMATFALSQGGVVGATSSAAGFQGYIIVTCNFPRAYGYATIVDKKTGSSTGYLAQIITKSETFL